MKKHSDTLIRSHTVRDAQGYLPLKSYGALGDGRAVALSGADGSIDWWCVPNMDSMPFFDRLLDAEVGGCFVIAPTEPFTVERRYRDDSNVLETVFTTASGRARLTESLNSGSAGRLPWAELARRTEGLDGTVSFQVDLRLSRRGDTANPYTARTGQHHVLHVEDVLAVLVHDDRLNIGERNDLGVCGSFHVDKGETVTIGLVAGENEPLVIPTIEQIDARIDQSDAEWRDWVAGLDIKCNHRDKLARSALALKLLVYAASGAIAAAPTTSLPERLGGPKNWDYRFAWIRDAGYTIRAFIHVGAYEEAKSALTWLLHRLEDGEPQVCYTLGGRHVPMTEVIDLAGYSGSQPVVQGNAAGQQHQHGIYGDIFETVAHFIANGNILDGNSAALLARLADLCADRWRRKDAGIWELEEPQHFTMSKISCWQALARAVELVDAGQLPTQNRERWVNERDRIAEWIGEHCWSEARGAYMMYPGSDCIDASLTLAVRFGFDGHDRLERTLDAIDRELGCGPFHYRYCGMEEEEGCFLACTFWMVEARALLGQHERAKAIFTKAMEALDGGVGIYSEMVSPDGAFLGNMPQGLTHLSIVQAIVTAFDDDASGQKSCAD